MGKNVSSSMYQERRMVDTVALCGQLSQISNKFLVGIIYKRRKKKLSTKIYLKYLNVYINYHICYQKFFQEKNQVVYKVRDF